MPSNPTLSATTLTCEACNKRRPEPVLAVSPARCGNCSRPIGTEVRLKTFATIALSLLALSANVAGTHVKSITDTLAATLPRMEFWHRGVRRATLTPAGELAASFTDTPMEDAMRIQNGADIFRVGAQFYSAAVSDDL